MHLKSLTVRGFKSFASSTTLDFEPGITAVVGPNGSGKSNVVDAIAWVMGEQGAKSLRGGKMEDVIFAGTSDKPPLGRAEVILTIDNSDGALPIDFTEVTISRTLFRSGGSEYAINGDSARLLDVQELLSDSGIGREMHVIVGQGRLDSILKATPDDRRGFIEEAAGVLKHRKRKEKALRKLDAMSANLTRLTDLTHELRRQLKPLGKQAEVARRSQVIQSDVRDAALRLLAHDVLTVTQALNQEEADEAALKEQRTRLQTELESTRARELEIEAAASQQAQDLAKANELHTRLTTLRERYRGLIALAQERAAYLTEPIASSSAGSDPDALDVQAQEADSAAAEIAQSIGELVAAHDKRVADEREAQQAADDARARLDGFAKVQAAHRESVVRLASAIDAVRGRIETRTEDLDRRERRRSEVAATLAELSDQRVEVPTGDDGAAEAQVVAAEQLVTQCRAAEQAAREARNEAREAHEAAGRRVVELTSRSEALQLTQRSGSAQVLAQIELPGLGSVNSCIRVTPGLEAAIDAALAFHLDADAVAVADLAAAVATVDALRSANVGSAHLLISETHPVITDTAALPADAQRASEAISSYGSDGHAHGVAHAVRQLLATTVVVADIRQAERILADHPSATVVSTAGDIVNNQIARGGYNPGDELAIQNELDNTNEALTAAEPTVRVAADELERAQARFAEASSAVEEAVDALRLAKERIVQRNAEISVIESQVAAAQDELRRLDGLIAQVREQLAADRATLEKTTADHAELVANEPISPGVTQEAIDDLVAAAKEAREALTQALLAVRAAEQRRDSLLARASELRQSAQHERAARAAAIAAAEQRRRQAQRAVAVLEVAQEAMIEVDDSVERSDKRRRHFQEVGAKLAAEFAQIRPRLVELAESINELTSDVHKDELARAEQKMRVDQLHEKSLEEYGVGPDELQAEYGPDTLVPPSPAAPGDEVDPDAPPPAPYPFDRAQQEKRLRAAQKAMALLGRVNPLALEEFAAMEERYAFLNKQLEDLKGSRKDLLDIIAEVDGRIQHVFAEAYADVAREFEGVFSRLFPGGEGRLVLTDPTDLLTTGIEVEARPAGKKIKRLSLLSGGERSLTAVAFLVSLFKARPSPFYIMDEVEAALDDVNLGRLIGLIQELQDSSQLLIITHQKRTMEVADALYGVTMRGGVTTVISQRVRELATTAG